MILANWCSPGVVVAEKPIRTLGFEPRQTESESVVLPLHHAPVKISASIVYAFRWAKPSETATLSPIQRFLALRFDPTRRMIEGRKFSSQCCQKGLDLKLGRETLSLAFPSSGMRQAFRWRPAFTKALTASATI